jgi:Fe2+ or Zn2+ uptake regulation protein
MMSQAEEFSARCKAAGILIPNQDRLRVSAIVFEFEGTFMPEDVVNRAGERGITVSRSTIFRTLEMLATTRMIRAVGDGYTSSWTEII